MDPQRIHIGPLSPHKLNNDILKKFQGVKYPAVDPRSPRTKRRAENRTQESPPEKTPKSLSRAKVNLSETIQEEESDPIIEMAKMAQKTNKILAHGQAQFQVQPRSTNVQVYTQPKKKSNSVNTAGTTIDQARETAENSSIKGTVDNIVSINGTEYEIIS